MRSRYEATKYSWFWMKLHSILLSRVMLHKKFHKPRNSWRKVTCICCHQINEQQIFDNPEGVFLWQLFLFHFKSDFSFFLYIIFVTDTKMMCDRIKILTYIQAACSLKCDPWDSPSLYISDPILYQHILLIRHTLYFWCRPSHKTSHTLNISQTVGKTVV
jgi:hypothetical protein